jgi:hypothetical protein
MPESKQPDDILSKISGDVAIKVLSGCKDVRVLATVERVRWRRVAPVEGPPPPPAAVVPNDQATLRAADLQGLAAAGAAAGALAGGLPAQLPGQRPGRRQLPLQAQPGLLEGRLQVGRARAWPAALCRITLQRQNRMPAAAIDAGGSSSWTAAGSAGASAL